MANRKKDFSTPTTAFLSSAQEQIPEVANIDLDSITIPAGYRLVRENKSQRLQLLVTPTIAANLKTAAALKEISLNELCNRIFEDYLKRSEA